MKLHNSMVIVALFSLHSLAFAKKNKNNDDESSSGSDSNSNSHYGGSNNNDDGSSTGSSTGGSSHYGGSNDDNSACTDSYYNCAQYVNSGYCPYYFCATCSYAHYCDASCDYCSSNPIPAPTVSPVHAPTKSPVHAPTIGTNTNTNDDYDYSEKCFINNCGCPGSFINSWCTIDNALVDSSWCQKNERNCEGSCSGTWCDGSSVPVPPTAHPVHAPTQHPIPSPTAHPIPHPTVHPIPSPTAHPIPRPTVHPIPSPTAHPIPSPTAHPIPHPTAHPIPSPTAHPIPRPTVHPIPAPTHHPVVDPIPAPTSSPIPRPTAQPIPSPTPSPVVNHDGGRTCFSADDRLMLENGKEIPFAKLRVGDKILSANRDGSMEYSKVVFLPHGENDSPTTFIKFVTEQNKEIKLTRGHLVQLCSGRLLAARLLSLDKKEESCLRTIDGQEQITSIEEVDMNGIYTAVAENEFLVVNGIIASPFAASAALAHAFFNITDMEDWCSSHNWMVYENLHHQPLLDVMSAHDTVVTPSEDCMTLLTDMFEKFKDEPIGWGVNGWGYRGWANPSSRRKSPQSPEDHPHLRQSKPKETHSTKNVPLPGIISGWE